MPPRPPLRRSLQAGFLGLLVLVPLLAWGLAWRGVEEPGRAPLPALPRDLAQLRAWPRAAEAALNDRFGLRTPLLHLRDQALFGLFGAFASPLIRSGPDGRLFLAGGETAALIRFTCGRGLSPGTLPELAAGVGALLRDLEARAPRAGLLLVPGAPVLYPAELPRALRRDCAAGEAFGHQLLARVSPEWRGRILFPQAALAAPDLVGPAIPHRFLHWDGVGAGRAVTAWAEEALGLPPRREMPVAWHWRPSDLTMLFPGLRLGSLVLEPRPEMPGMEACLGHPCFPEIAEIARVLVDVRRYRATAPEAGRLLVLSDSFGAAAAPWLARHYGEVWQFTLNHLDQLTPGQRRRLAQALLEEYRPDQVLVLMLDASLVLTLPRLQRLLE